MRHILSCSWGKDSAAAAIVRMEHNEPIDEIVYCRIMFDENTSAELPAHEDWIYSHAIPLMERRYGLKTTVVQSDRTYCEQFYTKYQKGKRIGNIYGFPFLRGPWCNDRLKTRPIRRWAKSVGEYVSIVGIAADEPKRIQRALDKGQILPLVEHGITEAQAMEICRKHDLLSPAYNGGRCRLGCWFCHNQRISELRRLRSEHPELWARMLELDADSPVTFKPSATVTDFDERFASEEVPE